MAALVEMLDDSSSVARLLLRSSHLNHDVSDGPWLRPPGVSLAKVAMDIAGVVC